MIAKLEGRHSWNGGAVVLNDLDVWPRFELSKINGLGSIGDTDDQRSNRQGRRGENVRPAVRRGKTVSYEGTIHARSLYELRQAEEDLGAAFDPLTYGGLLEGQMVAAPHPEAVRSNLLTNPSGETTIESSALASGSSVGPVNLVTNPSFGVDAAGWLTTADAWYILNPGATITRVAGGGHSGGFSATIASGGSAHRRGARFPLSGTFLAGVTYRLSIRTKLNSGNGLFFVALGDASANSADTSPTFTGVLTEYTVAWTPTANSSVATVFIANKSTLDFDVTIDAALVVEGALPPAYFDGDTPKYGWTGTPHASTSAPAVATYTRGDGGWAKVGTFSRRHRVIRNDAGAVNLIGASTVQGTGGVPVTAGRHYGVRASLQAEKTDTAITALGARIYWFNAAGTYISESAGPTVTPALTTLYDLFVVGQAPAGAAFAAVLILYSVSPGGVVSQYITHTDAFALFDLGTATKPVGAASLADDVPAYFDGDSPGALWLGVPHASISRLPGTDRTYRARPLSCIVPEEQTSNEWKRPFAVTLRLSDPRVFYPAEIPLAQSAGTAGDSSVVITNPGRTDADPILEIVGPTNAAWSVENTTLARSLRFTGFALTAGQTAVIDFSDRSIKLAGVDKSNLLDLAQSDWWDRDTPGLVSGANTITLKPGAGATAATRVGVRYRPADPA